jgi:hypothetical protein
MMARGAETTPQQFPSTPRVWRLDALPGLIYEQVAPNLRMYDLLSVCLASQGARRAFLPHLQTLSIKAFTDASELQESDSFVARQMIYQASRRQWGILPGVLKWAKVSEPTT